MDPDDDLYTCQVEPNFLKSNATSHKTPFSAIFELCDNSHDAHAKKLKIEFIYKDQNLTQLSTNCKNTKLEKRPLLKFLIDNEIRPKHTLLSLSDDGIGMEFRTLQEMVSFGFTTKSGGVDTIETNLGRYSNKNSNKCIGRFGNGFKSSSMRIGDNCLVVTAQEPMLTGGRKHFNLALLSYSMLKAEMISTVKVPMLRLEPVGEEDVKFWGELGFFYLSSKNFSN